MPNLSSIRFVVFKIEKNGKKYWYSTDSSVEWGNTKNGATKFINSLVANNIAIFFNQMKSDIYFGIEEITDEGF